MKVQFIDRNTATKMISSGEAYNYDLISISDTNKEKQDMRNMWLDCKTNNAAAIFLNFADVDNGMSGFTREKANCIVRFCDTSFKKKKDVLVHCFAGISRSGAVAKYINEYYALGDQYLDDYVGHNLWVYYTLLEVSGVETMRSYYTNLTGNDQ